MTEHRQLCTFFVDARFFGIDVADVQEIIRFQPITRIPLAPGPVAGLINLRGQIVPAIDVRRCFGLGDADEACLPTNVVLRTVDGPVSLLVDEIGEVLEVRESEFETTPAHLRGAPRELVRGVYKLETGLLMLASIEAFVTIATVCSADSAPIPATPKERTHVTH